MDGERVDDPAAGSFRGRCAFTLARWHSAWIVVVVVFAMVSGSAYGGEVRTITLRDGSTIAGEVLSLSGGAYTIQSATMGTITVKESDVRSITTTANAPGPSQLDDVKARMAADPDTMNAIAALQNDPDVQAVIEDPEVQRALQNGDLDALLANPKLSRLAADPKIEALTKRLSH